MRVSASEHIAYILLAYIPTLTVTNHDLCFANTVHRSQSYERPTHSFLTFLRTVPIAASRLTDNSSVLVCLDLSHSWPSQSKPCSLIFRANLSRGDSKPSQSASRSSVQEQLCEKAVSPPAALPCCRIESPTESL